MNWLPMQVHLSWTRQQEAGWRAAVSANQMMMNQRQVPPSYYRDLLGLSSKLIEEGHVDLAVVVAQMACEVLVEQTIAPRVPINPRQTFNLHNDATRRLYKKATGDDIDKAAFWPQYGPHAIRRHEVVHRGRRVSADEARESLCVSTQFVDYVEKVREGFLRRP